MKRLAVIPSDPIDLYLQSGYSKKWLEDYYNPCKLFDEVYLLSDLEQDNADFLGMKVLHTPAKEFKKRIRELGIDIVRAYGGNWACRVACEHKAHNIPVVVSVHDTNPKILYDSIKKADIVLSVSNAVKDLVATKFTNFQRSWILPNRVDFEVMHKYGEDEFGDLDEKYPFKYKILLVGRLTDQKNLDGLIKALKLLGREYCIIVVGKGETAVYKAMAQEQGVAEQCFFVDSVNHDELAKYYSLVDCMCTPSRWEGFGMVFIEALACEAVVVTSNIAPMNEFITDGENGLLVNDYEDPQALAGVVKKACCDENIRKHLKANARKSVEQFEKGHIDHLEADHYRKILKMKEEGIFDVPFWKRVFQING